MVGKDAVEVPGDEPAAPSLGPEGLGNLGGLVKGAETLLRVVPTVLCLAALVMMLKNALDNDYGSISYSNLSAFTYLVYTNAVCAGYSLLSACYMTLARTTTMSRAWTIFFFDQVLTYAILAAGTVSAEIIYLAYRGDEGVTWSKECGVFDGFCERATASIGITFGSVACYVLLSLISSYRLFSSYGAFIPFLNSKAVEIAGAPGCKP